MILASIQSTRALGHWGTGCEKSQETLLTEDLDITAGAKEKASQLKD